MLRQTLHICILLSVCLSCASHAVPTVPNGGVGSAGPSLLALSGESRSAYGRFWTWGYFDLEIARDGSSATVVPNRFASAGWGYHLNAVKLLEVHPCTDCVELSNLHLLPNGDVSVDVSLTHPWPADNLYCTGFDVRGIIMFPGSQYVNDNELRVEAGLPPYNGDWWYRISRSEKGDAVLVNADGFTFIWAPDAHYPEFPLDSGAPIFEYFPGKFASGENLATINGFRHYYTSDVRHMFEPGKTDTRTYVIRPPAQGPILASYAVYAHWAPPTTVPVTNPAADFPPEANSPMPYEFWITQDQPIDPDAPSGEGQGLFVHWHIKTWDIGYELWSGAVRDFIGVCPGANSILPHPSGEVDDYIQECDCFCAAGYALFPDKLPSSWPYIFRLEIDDPNKPWGAAVGTDYYIADIAIEAPDGEW